MGLSSEAWERRPEQPRREPPWRLASQRCSRRHVRTVGHRPRRMRFAALHHDGLEGSVGDGEVAALTCLWIQREGVRFPVAAANLFPYRSAPLPPSRRFIRTSSPRRTTHTRRPMAPRPPPCRPGMNVLDLGIFLRGTRVIAGQSDTNSMPDGQRLGDSAEGMRASPALVRLAFRPDRSVDRPCR